MKLDARRVAAFLRDPGACRVVLLYGEDAGLIRERAEALVRAVAGSLSDPFQVAELERGSLDVLPAEAAALSLTGGRRVVRVREVTDAAAAVVGEALAGNGEALVVLEAVGLAGRSRLRSLVEGAADAAAIGCYPDEGGRLEDAIRDMLAADGAKADSEALAWLGTQLGADRGLTRQELSKLATYVGSGGRVDLAAAMACVGDLAGLSLDDALFAAAAGDLATADRAFGLALAEGGSAVGVLRAALMHLQRLHRMRLAMDGGVPAHEAIKAGRPPVLFRRLESVRRALGRWSSLGLLEAMERLAEAERSCKQTGAPAEAICRGAVIGLAWEAGSRR
jgi:DNA polymerase III subunit delta